MSFSAWSALVAYLLTIACSVVLAMRASNWRIRLLGYTVGLLPLCQAAVLLGRNKVWISTAISDIAQMLELLGSALCLTAVHLLNVENRDRKSTDTRLRVFEAGTAQESRLEETALSTTIWHSSNPNNSERRRENRLPANCPVTVTVLGIHAPQKIPGVVVDLSGRGLGLKVPEQIAVQSPVKIESDDLLLLGEVCRCEAVGDEFSVGLQVQEWLSLPVGRWRVRSAEQSRENFGVNGRAQSNGDLAHRRKSVSSFSDGDQHMSIADSSSSRNA